MGWANGLPKWKPNGQPQQIVVVGQHEFGVRKMEEKMDVDKKGQQGKLK
jgi:hypothetical protein